MPKLAIQMLVILGMSAGAACFLVGRACTYTINTTGTQGDNATKHRLTFGAIRVLNIIEKGKNRSALLGEPGRNNNKKASVLTSNDGRQQYIVCTMV